MFHNSCVSIMLLDRNLNRALKTVFLFIYPEIMHNKMNYSIKKESNDAILIKISSAL